MEIYTTFKTLKSHEKAHVTKFVKCKHFIQYFIWISGKTYSWFHYLLL